MPNAFEALAVKLVVYIITASALDYAAWAAEEVAPWHNPAFDIAPSLMILGPLKRPGRLILVANLRAISGASVL
jgi:hypothetical protein